MRPKLMYVELKTGYNDNGPAWIGLAFFSRTGRSVYFDGKTFLKGDRNGPGNHLEYLGGDSYWISGIKKNTKDRHTAGNGKIKIDKNVVDEYLSLTKLLKLPNDKYEIVELNNTPPTKEFNRLSNEPIEPTLTSNP